MVGLVKTMNDELRVPETPRGFRDILPGEAMWRESLCEKVQERFTSWGYMPIETPTLEMADCMEAGGGIPGRHLSLIDADGRLLMLRPDVTLPIARMVASRLDAEEGPFRLRYTQQVYREQESFQAQSREFTQLGVESIGLSGPAADAEVITLLVEALRACNLERFTVAICTVNVLKALIAGVGKPDSWNRKVLAAYHASNLVELQTIADEPDVPEDFGRTLITLPRIRGGIEAIEECRRLVCDLDMGQELDELEATWNMVEAAGVSGDVIIDFGIMSGFDYYTGLVMEAYAAGFGLSLGGGGRYDNLLSVYGRSEPAAGFAFSLERVMQALRAQGQKVHRRTPDVLVGGDDMPAVFKAATEMRERGLIACLTASDDVTGQAQSRGIPLAYAIREGKLVKVYGEGE